MRMILVEGPVMPVVSLDDMKEHLRVTHDDENDKIEAFTAAATDEIDGITGIGRALVSQTWDLHLSAFDSDPVEIPLPPLIEVESIKYYDGDNVLQTLADSVYEVTGAGGHSPANFALKSGQSWPSLYSRSWPIVVRFRAGYVDTSPSPQSGEVPPPIVAAIKLKTGLLYDPPEKPELVEQRIASLLSRFRVYTF